MERGVSVINHIKDNPDGLDEITINIIDFDGLHYALKTLVYPNQNMMEVLREAEFQMGNCGGMALCASCHCFIESDYPLPNPSADEDDMLDQLCNVNPQSSRLICQIPMSKSLDGITIRIVRD